MHFMLTFQVTSPSRELIEPTECDELYGNTQDVERFGQRLSFGKLLKSILT
jgi:hypothetical protein